MNNKYINNERFLAHFGDTALNSYEKFKDVFDMSAQEFDEQSKNWLISISSGIKFDIYSAFTMVNSSSKENNLSPPSSERFLPQSRGVIQKHPQAKYGRNTRRFQHPSVRVDPKDISVKVDPRYILECYILLNELDQLEEYIDTNDYKKLANFIMFPLLRHARMAKPWRQEENLTKKDEVVAIRNAQIAAQRYANKQQQKNEAIALAEILWKCEKNDKDEDKDKKPDYVNFRHDEMTRYLVNPKLDIQKANKLFPDITEGYIRKSIADLARELGKRVLGDRTDKPPPVPVNPHMYR